MVATVCVCVYVCVWAPSNIFDRRSFRPCEALVPGDGRGRVGGKANGEIAGRLSRTGPRRIIIEINARVAPRGAKSFNDAIVSSRSWHVPPTAATSCKNFYRELYADRPCWYPAINVLGATDIRLLYIYNAVYGIIFFLRDGDKHVTGNGRSTKTR